jgi:hypothetical protein
MAGVPPQFKSLRPVSELDIEFQWHPGECVWIFDQNVQLIQEEILRALAGDKLVVYLSCPISSRAGSFANTNVEIAEFTAARLVAEWGPRFWIVNPTAYQLASKQGTGLINRYARQADRPRKARRLGCPDRHREAAERAEADRRRLHADVDAGARRRR